VTAHHPCIFILFLVSVLIQCSHMMWTWFDGKLMQWL